MMDRESVLRVTELVKEFGSFRAVDGLSFSLGKGEILGLLGANGAGKTTAMSMLLGLITPTSGSIAVFGKSLQRERISVLHRMNFSSAYTNLPGNLRVAQNLEVFANFYGIAKPRQRAQEMMERLEVTHLADRVTGHLSAGESTRVNLCKAFLNRPELLLLDEPTASLDPDVVDKVRGLIREIQREDGTSIIYTSHNMRDIEVVCDRVLFLHQGKVIREGTAEEIKAGFEEESLEGVFIRIARSGDLKPKQEEGNAG
ncbi:MAG: ABC transporter ATP-binding protein [Verrucomicrobiota bacterium]